MVLQRPDEYISWPREVMRIVAGGPSKAEARVEADMLIEKLQALRTETASMLESIDYTIEQAEALRDDKPVPSEQGVRSLKELLSKIEHTQKTLSRCE